MGIVSLRSAAQDLFNRALIAVATHSHFDHVGGLHEFGIRAIHPAEAECLCNVPVWGALTRAAYEPALCASLEEVGYAVPELLMTAYPHADFDPRTFYTPATSAAQLLAGGDFVDPGDRSFEVLHLPGHSPGGIGLWEARTGTLFSGDAVYDGPLLDHLPGSDIAAYVRTAERLLSLPVTIVRGGHDPSFGRERLRELLNGYLANADLSASRGRRAPRSGRLRQSRFPRGSARR